MENQCGQARARASGCCASDVMEPVSRTVACPATAGFRAGCGGWADSAKADRTVAPLLGAPLLVAPVLDGSAGTASWRSADSTSGATCVTLAAATSGGGRSRTVTLNVRRGGPGARHRAGVGGSHGVGPAFGEDRRHRPGGGHQGVVDDGAAERLLETGAGPELLPVDRCAGLADRARGLKGLFHLGFCRHRFRLGGQRAAVRGEPHDLDGFVFGEPAEQRHHDQRYKASQPCNHQREHHTDAQADEHEEGNAQGAKKCQVQCNRCRIFHFTLLTLGARPVPQDRAGDYAGKQPLTTIRTIYCRHARMASSGNCCFKAVIGRSPPQAPIG